MGYNETWSGDWRRRIARRLRDRGFASALEFARARPKLPLTELAGDLGGDDIAAAQIRTLLLEQATRDDEISYVLRDLFVRELCAALPGGWKFPLDEPSRFAVIGAMADWQSECEAYLNPASLGVAAQTLLAAPIPDGWLPEDPSDPIVLSFVGRSLGQHPS